MLPFPPTYEQSVNESTYACAMPTVPRSLKKGTRKEKAMEKEPAGAKAKAKVRVRSKVGTKAKVVPVGCESENYY